MSIRNKGEKYQRARHAQKLTYTFIIAPNSEGRTRKFTVSDFWLKNAVLFAGILITATVLLTVSYVSLLAQYSKSKQDLISLQTINKQQQVQLYDMSNLSKDVEQKLVYLDLLETKINTILNDNATLGGTGLSEADQLYLNEVNAKLDVLAAAMNASGGDGNAYMNYYVASNNVEDFDISSELDAIKTTLTEVDLSITDEQSRYEELTASVQTYDDMIECYPDGFPLESTDYRISGYFGYRTYPSVEFHSGIDFASSRGTHILAAGRGTVIYAAWYGGYGNCVIIDHGFGYETLYGHCSKLLVSVGDKVEKGDLIALVGSTGYSTGNHLHFEVHENGTKVNPFKYIEAN